VFVVDYSEGRHCRLVSSMAGVLMAETRLQVFDCSRDLEIAKSPPYTVDSRMLPGRENVILLLWVDEALIVMRLKTYLLDCAQGEQ